MASLSLCFGPCQAEEPNAQNMQVVGRAMSFVEARKPKTMRIAIVFKSGDPDSARQMNAAMQAVKAGLPVGDRVLTGVPVEQGNLSSASSYDGVFSISGVDQGALRAYLGRRGVPCFTLDDSQVRNGACIVAIRSQPSVSISFNSRNATAAGVKFATAFIMMVREL